ncbi:hypothetical protein PCANC_22170 [Puccinia coronata f. sp. avenae]|uniref:Uncharacterized protein n=1 Tax=Puccinia coronata f. sp. avenae TaxID=200324 RepID=A0A2N5UQK7_9BASI|nr:hypothetical protein PCANC_22170 [Puccinia coronata f. sp. avenae]PLW40040.1 hypothetical protein PCASD_11746 [Puccinia coronata f. sp. avenae]
MQVVSLIPSTSPLRASRTSRRAQAALRSAALRSEQQQHSGINPARDFMEICTGRESSRETPHGPLPAGDSNEISEGASTRLQVTSSINRRRKSALGTRFKEQHPVVKIFVLGGLTLFYRRILRSFGDSWRGTL